MTEQPPVVTIGFSLVDSPSVIVWVSDGINNALVVSIPPKAARLLAKQLNDTANYVEDAQADDQTTAASC